MSDLVENIPLALELPLDGRVLIEASAGTGKTYTLVALVTRLVVEVGLMPDQILVVTYTRAATAELRNRIRLRLTQLRDALRGDTADPDPIIAALLAKANQSERQRELVDARVEAALAGIAFASIDTIHAFCQRALAEGAFSRGSGFEAEIEPQPGMIRTSLVNDFWRRALSESVDARDSPWPESIRSAMARAAFDADKLWRWQKLAELGMNWSTAALHGGPRPETEDATDPQVSQGWLRHARRRLVETVRLDLPDRMRAAGLSDFEGLVRTLRAALRDEPTLARALAVRYPALLIDESQDTDGLQLDIFRMIHAAAVEQDAARALLVIVGDPKQAIYSFRGADLHSFLRVRDDFSTGQRRALLENRRSHDVLLAAADHLFTTPQHRGDGTALRMPTLDYRSPIGRSRSQLLVDDSEDAALTFLRIDSAGAALGSGEAREATAAVIADDIVRLLDDATAAIGSKRVVASDIAVLVVRNDEGVAVRTALARRGVPVASTTKNSVFEQPEADDLRLLMRALSDPTDEYRVRAALAGQLVGLDAAALDRLDIDVQWSDLWRSRMIEWFESWMRDGIGAAMRRAMASCDTGTRLAARSGGERAMTNYLHLLQLLDAAAIDDPLELLVWFDQQNQDSSHATIESDDPALLQIDSDGEQVRVMTMHGSKGLQFPIVYLAGLGLAGKEHEVLVALHHPDGLPQLDFDQDPTSIASARDAEFDQAMRLAYVGVTRAESRAFIVLGNFEKNGRTPLGWWLGGDVPQLDDRLLDLALDELKSRAGAGISSRTIEVDVEAEPARLKTRASRSDHAPTIKAASLKRRLPAADRRASFTALIAQGVSPDEPDHDQAVEESAPDTAPSPASEMRFGFRRGAAAGVCLHAIAETIDWSASSDAWLGIIDRELDRSAIEPADAAAVAEWFEEVRDAPIAMPGRAPFRLRDLAPSQWHREVAFDVPLRDADFAGVAQVARDAGFAVPELPPHRWRGMLRGFIDALVIHDDKLFVLDWKSNHLGDDYGDYDDTAMQAEMRLHGYHLQHLLYSVAVLRFLRRRSSTVDVTERFGGVVYAFIRGMSPDHAGAGLVLVPPHWPLLDSIDGILR
ncbi:exodeoxyribonuclease V subunit beta [soil metagenome]